MPAYSLIAKAALSVGVVPQLLGAVCWVETRHTNLVNATDGGSASLGVCQMKLTTARHFNAKLRASELLTVEGNAYYAALYLKHQLMRYNGHVACAITAYNRGHAAKTCRQFDISNIRRDTYYTAVKRAMTERPWEGSPQWTVQEHLNSRTYPLNTSILTTKH